MHTFISVITINVILKEKRQILQIAFYLLFPRSAFPDFSGRLVESHFAAIGFLMDLLGRDSGGLSLYIERQSCLVSIYFVTLYYNI